MSVTLLHFPIPGDGMLDPVACDLLTEAERLRADRFRSLPARSRFVIGRAVVRLIAGGDGRSAAAAAPLFDREGGKPYCATPGAACFNLSHTGPNDGQGDGLVAIARDEVGVDLETVRPLTDLPGLTRLVLSPAERTALLAMAETDRARTFLRLWCCKEAVLKAAGVGMAHDPRTIDVAPLPSAALINRRVSTAPTDLGTWFVSEIDLGERLVGAMACTRPVEWTLQALTLTALQTWLATGHRPAPCFRGA